MVAHHTRRAIAEYHRAEKELARLTELCNRCDYPDSPLNSLHDAARFAFGDAIKALTRAVLDWGDTLVERADSRKHRQPNRAVTYRGRMYLALRAANDFRPDGPTAAPVMFLHILDLANVVDLDSLQSQSEERSHEDDPTSTSHLQARTSRRHPAPSIAAKA